MLFRSTLVSLLSALTLAYRVVLPGKASHLRAAKSNLTTLLKGLTQQNSIFYAHEADHTESLEKSDSVPEFRSQTPNSFERKARRLKNSKRNPPIVGDRRFELAVPSLSEKPKQLAGKNAFSSTKAWKTTLAVVRVLVASKSPDDMVHELATMIQEEMVLEDKPPDYSDLGPPGLGKFRAIMVLGEVDKLDKPIAWIPDLRSKYLLPYFTTPITQTGMRPATILINSYFLVPKTSETKSDLKNKSGPQNVCMYIHVLVHGAGNVQLMWPSSARPVKQDNDGVTSKVVYEFHTVVGRLVPASFNVYHFENRPPPYFQIWWSWDPDLGRPNHNSLGTVSGHNPKSGKSDFTKQPAEGMSFRTITPVTEPGVLVHQSRDKIHLLEHGILHYHKDPYLAVPVTPGADLTPFQRPENTAKKQRLYSGLYHHQTENITLAFMASSHAEMTVYIVEYPETLVVKSIVLKSRNRSLATATLSAENEYMMQVDLLVHSDDPKDTVEAWVVADHQLTPMQFMYLHKPPPAEKKRPSNSSLSGLKEWITTVARAVAPIELDATEHSACKWWEGDCSKLR